MPLGVAKHLVQPLGQVLKGAVLMKEITVPGWRAQEDWGSHNLKDRIPASCLAQKGCLFSLLFPHGADVRIPC